MALSFYQEQYAYLPRGANREKGLLLGRLVQNVKIFFTRRGRHQLQESTPESQYLTDVLKEQVDQGVLARFRERDRQSPSSSVVRARCWQPDPAVANPAPLQAVRHVVEGGQYITFEPLQRDPQPIQLQVWEDDDWYPVPIVTIPLETDDDYDASLPDTLQPIEDTEDRARIIDRLFDHYAHIQGMDSLPKGVFPPDVKEAYLLDNLLFTYGQGIHNAFATVRLSAKEDAVLAQLYRKAIGIYDRPPDRTEIVTHPLGTYFLDENFDPPHPTEIVIEDVQEEAKPDTQGVITLLGTLRSLYRNWRDEEWTKDTAIAYLRNQIAMGKSTTQIVRGHQLSSLQLAALQELMDEARDTEPKEPLLELHPVIPKPVYMEYHTWVMMQPGYIPEQNSQLSVAKGDMQI